MKFPYIKIKNHKKSMQITYIQYIYNYLRLFSSKLGIMVRSKIQNLIHKNTKYMPIVTF